MIPDYQTLMRPVLDASQYGEVSIKTVLETLANQFQLSEEERQELLPSGKQQKFSNRVNWAKSYLKQAGLVKATKRGCFVISEDGQKALVSSEKIDNAFLAKYAAFQEFKNRTKEASKKDDELPEVIIESFDSTPDEMLRKAHQSINDALALELLSSIRDCSPAFFEQLIVDLLIAMGYGGTSEDAGRALGRSGDNGIDGVIDQDPLGVDQILILPCNLLS